MAGLSDEEMMGYAAPAARAMSDEEMMAAPAEKTHAQEDNDYYGPALGWMSALGSGMAKGAAALPGIPGTIQHLARKAEPYIGIKTPEHPLVNLPTSEETTEALKPYVSALNEEATTPGQKIAETVGEFAVAPGPAGKGKGAEKALEEVGNMAKQFTKEAVVPGATSEVAGQATEGTDLEPVARIAGAIAPGVATSGLRSLQRATDPSEMRSNIEAAKSIGVDLPTFAASEGPLGAQSAAALQALPVIGNPVTEATKNTLEQMGEAAHEIHGKLGSPTPQMAGTSAETAIHNWIRGPSATQLDAAFKDMYDVVPHQSETPLTNLGAARDKIVARRTGARLPNKESGATDLVKEALADPTPMTFEDARRLRTEIGNHLSALHRLPGDVNEGELKQLYKALTTDLRDAARRAGGEPGVRAFDLANRTTDVIRGQQNRLARIVGATEGKYSPEQILGNIEKLASVGTKSDINRLLLARRAISSPRDWQNVAGGIIGHLGRDNLGNFSADRFVTGYNKMSPEGRDILFGPPGSAVRKSLDALGQISEKMQRVGRHTNTSKTAHVAAYLTAATALLTSPFTILPKAVAGYGVARALSSPTVAPYAAGLAQAISAAAGAGAAPNFAVKSPAVRAAYSAYVKAIQNETGQNREQRAAGGKVQKKDYPAKRLTLAARRAFREIAEETKPIMDLPDEHVAASLHAAKE